MLINPSLRYTMCDVRGCLCACDELQLGKLQEGSDAISDTLSKPAPWTNMANQLDQIVALQTSAPYDMSHCGHKWDPRGTHYTWAAMATDLMIWKWRCNDDGGYDENDADDCWWTKNATRSRFLALYVKRVHLLGLYVKRSDCYD